MQPVTSPTVCASFAPGARSGSQGRFKAKVPTSREGGFTLLELLVVIVILGIVAGMVSLSIAPSEQRRLTEELDRLAALFRLAHDEARVGGIAITWQADAEGYRFLVSDGERGGIGSDDPLRARIWPFDVREVIAPDIVFGREPLMSPVRVQIATPTRVVIMDLDAFGELTVLQ
jgi:general secretion pathway protein H